MKTGHDVIEKTASACWNRAHPDEDCPEDKIPGKGELVAWAASRQHPQVPPCPPDALAKASELLAALYPHHHDEGGAWHWVEYLEDPPEEDPPEPPAECKPARSLDAEIIPEEIIPRPHVEESLLAVFPFREGDRRYGDLAAWWTTPRTTFLATLPEMAATYKALPRDEQQSFPLSPIVQAWQARPLLVEPYRPKDLASLPALYRKPDAAEQLKLIDAPYQPSAPRLQTSLQFPELAPPGTSWLINAYRLAGGPERRPGRGAQWDLHLMVGALLHTPIKQRDGLWHSFRIPTEEAITWLHPHGWGHKARDWQRFPEALDRLNRLGWISIEGVGRVQMVSATTVPEKKSDPYVEFVVRIPTAAANGARLDWPTLCKYRTESAPLYRAYLSACDLMHQSARYGKPITRLIGEMLTAEDGTFRRAKGGKVKRSKSEMVPNASAKYVVGHHKRQLAQLIGIDPDDRHNRADALAAFEQLDADGVIELNKEGHGRGEKYFIYGRNRAVDADYEVS